MTRYVCAGCNTPVAVVTVGGSTHVVRACSCAPTTAVIANASGKAAGHGGAIGR